MNRAPPKAGLCTAQDPAPMTAQGFSMCYGRNMRNSPCTMRTSKGRLS